MTGIFEALKAYPRPLPLKAGAMLLAMAICLFFLASTVNIWLKHFLEPAPGNIPPVETAPAASPKPSPAAQQSGPRPETQIVLSRNIFGGDPRARAGEQDEGVALAKIPLAKNLQNYSLVGTIVNDTGQNYAIIKDDRKQDQLLLQEGDRLDSARITRILRNNVVIQRDSQEQMLSIDYSARNLMQSSLGPAEDDEPNGSPGTIHVDIDKEFISQTLSNVQSFMQQAQIIPYMKDGQPAGYRLRSIQPGSAFDKLGLQNGDVIISLNGESIESPGQLSALRDELTNTDRASLGILRGGREMDIDYSLN